MTIIAEFLIMPMVGYLINIASGERSAAIAATRDAKLRETLEKDEVLRKALASTHSIRDEVRGACTELARNRANLGVPAHEEPLWHLLSDDVFQADLTEWLMVGAIEEGNVVKSRLLQTMKSALANGGASPEQITHFTTGYFDAVDKAIFTHPVLAHWRQQLSLDYLREQVTALRKLAEEAVGVYSPAKQKAALDRYCKKALALWDIIDLSNLPEGDVQITTQQLLLRQLYMPLRIEVEQPQRGEDADSALAKLEQGREARRHREAGHFSADKLDLPGFISGERARTPIGERLGVSRRLVVLGDPGGGKTTMLRWMATAYLLRHTDDPAFSKVPDTATLPNQPWIPVLIRCRELGEVDLCQSFTDFLTQHLNQTELLPDEASVMRAVILDRIAKGEALILVDGLDEITNSQVRMQFCQQLERTAARYPSAPIVVTSRIVGYRDMPYRMGSGFEHGVIAEMNREDKDLFAQRWIEVTEQHQPAQEKAKRVQELIDALHSSDRIERLTGNPMLLTTLALVKRKVGKLPNRRTKLYAEAVTVLLNWNPRRYEIIEEEEAIPQLEYLAYEMCRRGVQRLTDHEVLDLLEKLRVEYPNIRSIRRREPEAFLALLEARSSILIKSGSIWQENKGRENTLWEFRHLTFQEFLAARALIDGRYPERDKTKTLAEQVAPLAGVVEQSRRDPREAEVTESWREALRLLVAGCNDDEVEAVLLAILNPIPSEDPQKTTRARAVLAALCLADEPNVGEDSTKKVIEMLVGCVSSEDGGRWLNTTLDAAALALLNSIWSGAARQALMNAALEDFTGHAAVLWGEVEYVTASQRRNEAEWKPSLLARLSSRAASESASAAMAISVAVTRRQWFPLEELIPPLTGMISTGGALGKIAVESLYWVQVASFCNPQTCEWTPDDNEAEILMGAFTKSLPNEVHLRQRLLALIPKSKHSGVRAFLQANHDHSDFKVRRVVNELLVPVGARQAIASQAVLGLPPGITNTLGWTDGAISKKLTEVREILDWEHTTGRARKWWEAFENENSFRTALILRLAEELAARKTTIAVFFLIHGYGDTDNVQANLDYFDYIRLKKDLERGSREGTEVGGLQGGAANVDEPFAPPGAGITDSSGMDGEQVSKVLEETRAKFDWANTDASARKWWEGFEYDRRDRKALLLRLLEELATRNATINEFFEAHTHSNTKSLQATLYYLDYSRLKKKEERKKMNELPPTG
jgi:hypothetical protein